MKQQEFKPFDKVLVRDGEGHRWMASLYSHKGVIAKGRHITMSGSFYECVPYNEDTEHLLGTTDDYVESYVPEDGDICVALVDGCKWMFIFKEYDSDSGNKDCIRDYVSYSYAKQSLYLFSSLTGIEDLASPIRLADEKEKQLLLTKLAEAGKQWNPEKKCIEDVWTPQDGDFVVSGWKEYGMEAKWVAIVQRGLNNSTKHYCSYAGKIIIKPSERTVTDFWIGQYCDSMQYTRLATEEEKQLLLDALHEEGKDWDEVKKEIVEYKWKPKEGDEYFYVTPPCGVSSYLWNGKAADESFYRNGNCFRTKEAAQAMADKFKKLLKGGKE